MGDKYILKGHTPVECQDLMEWARWFENGGNRRVAFDRIGKSEVSTVFLGLDHNFCGGRPLLFETMVFGGPWDGQMRRYSTWEEAEAGHQQVCLALQASQPQLN